VFEIREKYSTGVFSQKQLSIEYLVAPSSIRSIIENRSWKI
jgi:hypothetical protein